MVVLPSKNDYDDEFEIESIGIVEVVTKGIAINNMLSYDGFVVADVQKNTIGYYTRLIDSDFFFRWL